MRRKTFDGLMATGGLVLAVVLLVAGGLLTWAHVFVTDQVSEQLSAQKIIMPEGDAIADPAIKPYLSKYAGQPLTTGAQAEAYANHYIAVHLKAMSGNRSYAELSDASRANPDDAELAGLVATAFKGETLRGLLLNAYAFGTMGQIAFYAAIAAFIGAGLLLLMSVLGLVHARRTDPVEVLGGRTGRADPVLVG
jgi:hypothetical protein